MENKYKVTKQIKQMKKNIALSILTACILTACSSSNPPAELLTAQIQVPQLNETSLTLELSGVGLTVDQLTKPYVELGAKWSKLSKTQWEFSIDGDEHNKIQLVFEPSVNGYVSLTRIVDNGSDIPSAGFIGFINTQKQNSSSKSSIENIKKIGFAIRLWAGDHGDQYPWNVSREKGGVKELCNPDSNGFEQNPATVFMVMSNELENTKILVCPNDPDKQVATSFSTLTANNISYQLRTGPNVDENHPQEILVVDPINGIVAYCDGSVQTDKRYKK